MKVCFGVYVGPLAVCRLLSCKVILGLATVHVVLGDNFRGLHGSFCVFLIRRTYVDVNIDRDVLLFQQYRKRDDYPSLASLTFFHLSLD